MGDVIFKRGDTERINNTLVVDGQILFDTENRSILIDYEDKRIPFLRNNGIVLSCDGSNFYAEKDGYKKKLGASEGNANTEQVLKGVTFNSSKTPSTQDYSVGTMPNNSNWSSTPTENGKVVIPKGYHNGSGYVDTSKVYSSGYSNGSADGMLSAKNQYNPKTLTLSKNGELVVNNIYGNTIATKTFENSYNSGYSLGNSNGYSNGYNVGKSDGINAVSFISISSSSVSYGNYANCRQITFPIGTKQAIVWSAFKERYDGHTGWQPTIVTSGNCTYNKVGHNFDYTLYPDDNLDRIGVGTYLVNITDSTQPSYVIFKHSNSANGYYII